jgi:hypothetical protein
LSVRKLSDQGRLVSLLTLLRLMPYRSVSLGCVMPARM